VRQFGGLTALASLSAHLTQEDCTICAKERAQDLQILVPLIEWADVTFSGNADLLPD